MFRDAVHRVQVLFPLFVWGYIIISFIIYAPTLFYNSSIREDCKNIYCDGFFPLDMKDMGPDMVNFDYLTMNILNTFVPFSYSTLRYCFNSNTLIFLQSPCNRFIAVAIVYRLCLRPGSHFQGGLGCFERTKRFSHSSQHPLPPRSVSGMNYRLWGTRSVVSSMSSLLLFIFDRGLQLARNEFLNLTNARA